MTKPLYDLITSKPIEPWAQKAMDARASAASSTAKVEHREVLFQEFHDACRGHGRAGTADNIDGPYMSMTDAANVYADLMLGRTALATQVQPAAPVLTETGFGFKVGEVEQEAIDAWLQENCGRGLPHGEVTDMPGALHALAYVLRQIEGTDSYRPHIGQCNSATTGIRFVLDHLARQALAQSPAAAETVDIDELARPRCGCPPETVRRVIVDHGTCAMGGCPYGGDF